MPSGPSKAEPCLPSSPGVLPAEKTSARLGYLDALRGIAILGVLLVHSVLDAGVAKDSPLGHIGFVGQRGVQLFYMVSAFTLFYTLDNGRPEHHRITNFYLRRFFRIAPLFYCAILFNLLVNGAAMRWVYYALGFVFLHGLSRGAINSVTPGSWSIAVETSFYVLVPLLFFYVRTTGRAVALFCIAAAILMPMSWLLAYRATPEYFSLLWFPVEFPVFLLGIVAYMVWKFGIRPGAGPSIPLGASQRRSLSAILLILSAALLLGNLNLYPATAVISWRNMHMLSSSMMFLPLILALSLYEWRILVNPFTRYLGKISYSIYLAHVFVIEGIVWVLQHNHSAAGSAMLHRLQGNILGAAFLFVCVLVLCLPVCSLLWRFVEQPGIRLGRRLIAAREHRTARRATPLVPPMDELGKAGNTLDAQF